MASDLNKDPSEEAQELGLRMVSSEDKSLKPHIQIDLDSDEAWEDFQDRWGRMIQESKGVLHPFLTNNESCWLVTRSKSGNRHVYILLAANYTALERIACQALLASDMKREFFGMIRAFQDRTKRPASVLFETPVEFVRVMGFLKMEAPVPYG